MMDHMRSYLNVSRVVGCRVHVVNRSRSRLAGQARSGRASFQCNKVCLADLSPARFRLRHATGAVSRHASRFRVSLTSASSHASTLLPLVIALLVYQWAVVKYSGAPSNKQQPHQQPLSRTLLRPCLALSLKAFSVWYGSNPCLLLHAMLSDM